MATPVQNFGRYQLTGILGQGGFATVYRALDPALGREVAIKALLAHYASEPEIRQRFVGEGQALARLRHPNIVAVYDVGEANGVPFYAMELVTGQTLAVMLAGGQALNPGQTVQILRPLAAALDYLHASGLVHRDIKPANIMLEPAGRVVLMDFGIARALDGAGLTQTGTTMGTPAYMSPEQVRGQAVGPASDVYSLGVIAYQMLSGHPPFQGDTAYMLHAHAFEAPPPLLGSRPSLPRDACLAVEATLAKDSARRPRSAAEFVAQMAGEAPLPATPPPSGAYLYVAPPPNLPTTMVEQPGWPVAGQTGYASSPPRSRSGTRGALIAGMVGGAALLGVLVVAGIAAFSGRSDKPVTPTTAARSAGAIRPATAAVVATASAVDTRQVGRAAGSLTPTAVATAKSAPSAPPTVPTPALGVANFALQNVEGWWQGQGELAGCYSFDNAPAGSRLHIRVVRGVNEKDAVVDGPESALPAASGAGFCSIVGRHDPLPHRRQLKR